MAFLALWHQFRQGDEACEARKAIFKGLLDAGVRSAGLYLDLDLDNSREALAMLAHLPLDMIPDLLVREYELLVPEIHRLKAIEDREERALGIDTMGMSS